MTLTISTSWDDGHALDLRVADMLDEAGMRGTFYIARDFIEPRLTDAEIRDLAQRHEIGAHTLTHPTLTHIPLDEAEREIYDSKTWLEDIIGREVTSFCYPRGATNTPLQRIVEACGYRIGRGVGAFAFNGHLNRFNMETTLQIYPFPLRPMPDVPLTKGWRARTKPLRDTTAQSLKLGMNPLVLRQWHTMATAWAARSAQAHGVFHLWGHSWEIERYNQWGDLRRFLKAITAQHDDIIALTNTELALGDHSASSS